MLRDTTTYLKGVWYLPCRTTTMKRTYMYLGCHVEYAPNINTTIKAEAKGTFNLILKDSDGKTFVERRPAEFRVIVGYDEEKDWGIVWEQICKQLGNYANMLVRIPIGSKGMMFRRRGYAHKLVTSSYYVYDRLKAGMKWVTEGCRQLGVRAYECNTAVEPEEQMKSADDIVGAQYINLYFGKSGKVTKIERATEEDVSTFGYKPRIAGYDNEMLTLDALDPNSGPYITSYYVDDTAYVFYTDEFCPEQLSDLEVPEYKIVPVHCKDKVHLVESWMKKVYETRPDVVTGYYIYHADVPTSWAPMARSLKDLPADPQTGIVPYIENTRKLDKHSQDSERGMVFCTPGIAFVDMYSHLMKVLPNDEQAAMGLDQVAERYLQDRKRGPGYAKLRANYYSRDLTDKVESITYAAHDAYLAAKLYVKFGVWEKQRAMYTITGVDLHRQLTTGMVLQVYGALLQAAARRNELIDTPTRIPRVPGGGYVPDPIPGIHTDVAVLDVAAMYPRIVEMLLACPSNLYGSKEELYKAAGSKVPCVEVLDRDDCTWYMRTDVQPLFYSFVKQCLMRREELRGKVKAVAAEKGTDSIEYRILSAEEMAVKELANSAVGALGEHTSGTNPILCTQLNDIVTTTGRSYAKYIQQLARENGFEVIYGDTDSVFCSRGKEANKLLDILHKHLPPEIRLKEEYVAKKLLISKKKHYITLDYNDKLKIAGYKCAKSSAPVACRRVFEASVMALLKYNVEAMQKVYAVKKQEYIDNPVLADLCWKFKHSGKIYASGTAKRVQIDTLAQRNIVLVPGELRQVTYVYCHEDYVKRYNRQPAMQLPLRCEIMRTGADYIRDVRLTYTAEEITDEWAVNVSAVIDHYCAKTLTELAALQKY